MMQDLSFVKINCTDENNITTIYEILKRCGTDMFEHQGLSHWKTPYSIENIKNDCNEKFVFLVFNGDVAVATFMLSIDDGGVLITKFAVLPSFSGKKIGTRCIEFINNWCLEKSIKRIHLDVYDQSKIAIKFYERNGFTVYDSAPTRRFKVLLMERYVQ